VQDRAAGVSCPAHRAHQAGPLHVLVKLWPTAAAVAVHAGARSAAAATAPGAAAHVRPHVLALAVLLAASPVLRVCAAAGVLLQSVVAVPVIRSNATVGMSPAPARATAVFRSSILALGAACMESSEWMQSDAI
jgi:hypothetical protein